MFHMEHKHFYNITLKFWDEFNANFVLLYFSSYSSERCGEKQYGSAFKVGPDLSVLKSFQY